MSLWKIALRSIQQRGLASALTMASMALGVMMVVCILSIHGIVAESFSNSTQTGYQLIVGATKGGKLQITLNTVFYLSSPVENIPFDYYLEFVSSEERDRQFQHSFQHAIHELSWEAIALAGSSSGDLTAIGAASALVGATADYRPCIQPLINQPIAERAPGKKTRYGEMCDFAIPVCLGDYLGPYRVIGTTPDFFEKLKYGKGGGKSYQFVKGRNFQEHSKEHGYFEAVIGAIAAKQLKLNVGDHFSPAHGASEEEGGDAHHHEFTIVGKLAPTGTPNDRAVFINMEGFFLLDDHAKPLGVQAGTMFAEDPEPDSEDHRHDEHEHKHQDSCENAPQDEHQDHSGHAPHDGHEDHSGHSHGSHSHDSHAHEPQRLPVEQREVTAVLVRAIQPSVALGLHNQIDEQDDAQAVLPMLEIFRLFMVFVNPIKQLLVVLTVMICVVSGISILVSIYNSMSDRRREIAIMRALGAERATVMTIILLESVLLALGGGIFGWLCGHGLNALASGFVEQMTGVAIGFLSFAPGPELLQFTVAGKEISLSVSTELLIIPGLMTLAVIVGLLPAWTAYQTDVARSLSE